MITTMILIIIRRKPVIELKIKNIYKEIIESDPFFVLSLPKKGIKSTFKNYWKSWESKWRCGVPIIYQEYKRQKINEKGPINIWYYKKNAVKQTWRAVNESSKWRCCIKKRVLKNFAEFTGRHLCRTLYLSKVTDVRSAFLIRKGTQA